VVVVTGSSVPPVIPGTVRGRGVSAGSVLPSRRPLPLAVLSPDRARQAGLDYALSAVDKSGRIADRGIVRVLGWLPGTRLEVRERSGVMVAGAAAGGAGRIDGRGHLVVPLSVRRWIGLAAGDRLLLVADPAGEVLVASPFAVLDRLLAGLLAEAGGAA
jgi:hypothetical protein